MQHDCIQGWPVESDDHLPALCTQQSACSDIAPPKNIMPASYAEAVY
jgi:hypothetical protein